MQRDKAHLIDIYKACQQILFFTEDFRTTNTVVDWSLIAGTRDKLIHQYDAVDLQIVWNTVEKEIPKLISKIEPLLPPKK